MHADGAISCHSRCDELKRTHLAHVRGRQAVTPSGGAGCGARGQGFRHLCTRAARASACRHYDRRARCLLDWDRTARVTPVERRKGLRRKAVHKILRSARVSGSSGLGCASGMSSPLGKSRSGTPEGVRVPLDARRTCKCGGWTLRLPAFCFLFVAGSESKRVL